MNEEVKASLMYVFALLGESFNRMEMILMSDGSKESRLAILGEIGVSQEHIKTASDFLVSKD